MKRIHPNHWSKNPVKKEEVTRLIKESVAKIDKESWKENISKSLTGREVWNTGLPKEQQPRYGKPASEKQIENMRVIGKQSHPTWNKDLSELSPRLSNEIIRKFVLNRDGNKCTQCGNEEQLIIHHVEHFEQVKNKEEIHSIENLKTLCRSCHMTTHNKQKLDLRNE